MKIIWNENPFATAVELTDHEKEVFRLKLKVEELIERAGSAYFTLAWIGKEYHKKTKDESIAEAMRLIDVDYLYDEGDRKDNGIDKRVDELYNWYMEDLAGAWHSGDCTCFPCSCTKCHVEDLLGLNTMQGLGKYGGSALYARFSKGMKTDEIIEDTTLKTEYRDWLRNYRDVHFPQDGYNEPSDQGESA